MTKLYVIGNGFDLCHGLPTGYDRFHEFARDTLNKAETYYRFALADTGPWSDFEKSLGCFDWHSFYEAHDNTDVTAEDFRLSEAYGLEDDLTEQAESHVNAIRKCFKEWIDGIDVSAVERKFSFTPEDRFFTFNYTLTLQSVYGIEDERVFHVHGRSDGCNELIFGHGKSMKEEPEVNEGGGSNRTIFSAAEDSAKYPFYALQKPVSKVIEENRIWFEALRDVVDIVVIGHSLNGIDLPYFQRIANCAQGSRWMVFGHNVQEELHHKKQLLKCGVQEDCIQTCAY